MEPTSNIIGLVIDGMKREIANKQIYDDFMNKTVLNDNEKDVLDRYIRNHSIVKIAEDTKQSTATVSRIIANIKKKYDDYKKLELAKLMILKR